MENTTPSPLEAVHIAIKSQNIFSQAGIVRKQNIWEMKFPDVTTINAHASDTVFQALEQVKISELDKVTSIVFTAQHGVGKTHLLKRVCYQGKRKGETSFIYANIGDYTDLNLANYQFQQSVVDSLANLGSQEVTQWQEIATKIVNEVVRTPKSPQSLISQFDAVYNNSLAKGQNLLDLLVQKINQTHKNIDPYIVRAVLWTLSEKYSSYAVKWLSGNVLESTHAKFLGLPANLEKTNQERETEALKIVQQILKLVGDYHSVIICFDEIETQQGKTNDAGLIAPQVVTLLVKSLYDTLHQSQLSKGVVIITVTLPDTWINDINTMPGGISDRISAYTQRKAVELQPVDANSMIELVKLWLNIFYTKKKLVPPHPIYPFTEKQLKEYSKQKTTIREIIQWCGVNFKVKGDIDILPPTPQERFNLALSREKEEEIAGEMLEDSEIIGEILQFGFTSLIGQEINAKTLSGEKIEALKIQEITEIAPKSKNGGRINFKIVGTENNKELKIGIAVLQHSHGLSVGAGMTRLIDYETFDLTRGCLVRSKDKKIKKYWDSYEYLNRLIEQLGGEWVDLKREEIEPILKLYGVYQQRERYQLSEEQIFSFSRPEMLKNSLLLEILSDPSGNSDELIDPFPSNDPPIDEKGIIDRELEDILNSFGKELEDEDNKTNNKQNNIEISNQSQKEKNKSDVENIEEPETKWFEMNYTGKSIKSCVFLGQEYEVNSWKDFLITISTLFKLTHNREFEKVLEIKGRSRSYFNKNPDNLNKGEKISGTNIYLETNLNANRIVQIVYQMIKLFEYSDDSLAIKLDE